MQETMIDYKQNIYQELSRLTKGLGSEKRLDILNILSQGPKTVEELRMRRVSLLPILRATFRF